MAARPQRLHVADRRSRRDRAPLPSLATGMSGLALPRLGMGTAAIGNLYQAVSDEAARSTVIAALDAGIGYFDTAPHYGFGLAERRLGAALAEYDGGDSVILSTKVGRLLKPTEARGTRHGFVDADPFEPQFDYGADGIRRSYEASLKRLAPRPGRYPARARSGRGDAWRPARPSPPHFSRQRLCGDACPARCRCGRCNRHRRQRGGDLPRSAAAYRARRDPARRPLLAARSWRGGRAVWTVRRARCSCDHRRPVQ